jgi:endonuclease/exonuclease/phosphatase family metal-dependent hydrolase
LWPLARLGGGGGAGGGRGGGGGSAGATCEDTGSAQDVVFDTFNLALAGNFVPYVKDRRQPLMDAMAQLDSDVVCLQEVWEQSDKDLVASAVAAKYPHVLSYKHDLDTVIDDATGADGKVPKPPSTPPCSDADVAGITAKLNAAVDCLRDNCSIDGSKSEDSATISSACATNKCASKAISLLNGSKRCYGCLLPQLPTESFKDIRTECTTNPKAGVAFRGQNGLMLLSKHPVESSEVVVLPGTWNRRAVIHARVAVPNGSKVDVYCHHMTPIFKGTLYPYTGQYGAGSDPNGWVNEQLLHAKKLVAMAQKNSCGPAVVLGDLNASHAYPTATPPILIEGEGTLKELEKVFQPGVAANYTPACTYCKANQNVADNDSGADQWIDHLYLLNIDPARVKSTALTFVDPVVNATDDMGSPLKVELSDHYGLRSVITLGK